MIGVDIESILRFNKLERRKDRNFLNRVFSARELEYCYSKKNPAPHLAARFAGKEAINKAFLSNGHSPLPQKEIEILNDSNGAPYVNIKSDSSKDQNYVIEISLSHNDKNAVAFVVMLTKNK
ncbi:MAG: holo-ACP synthase [Patescibacteria group bacterium]